MPESPEVKLFAKRLNASFATQQLLRITIVRGPYKDNEKEKYKHFREQAESFQPHVIKRVKNKGKWLYFKLDGPEYAALGVHHGMEGSWCNDPDNKHIILELKMKCDQKITKIYFQDSRRFGTFTLLTKEELQKELKKLGPDIFKMTLEEFDKSLKVKRIQKHRLCEALMDQSVISGIGNYLRADIMYLAKLDPKIEVFDLDESDKQRLYNAIRKVSRSSYGSGSTTVGYYESAIHNGGYEFLVYQKAICPKGKKIQTFKDKNGRTVHYVPLKEK
uniref:Formamidopyrimidine-DNA glycosylase n=1 Tax=Marseillevirus LCMAC101 TaxID=2506602 RepID=A0A481YRD3_9VIRU|nr:MAG: formamidopyrimidine-DNA glycosylase [Marseillevirus LCMAC101]